MNRDKIRLMTQLMLYVGLAMLAATPVLAQVPVDEDGNPIAPLQDEAVLEDFDDEELPVLSAAELEDIVGLVALYPDDLLAIVLPASTYPLQVVQAARFLERLEEDSSLKPDEEWDESITALLNYPEVIDLMNADIDWTWRLGEAVVAQQADVIAAIETFRDKAYAAGNLKSDERQTVSNENGVIEIAPVDEDVIYVPYYEPEQVVVYQTRPVYHYYPYAYPVYYYPYSYGHSFGSHHFWGVTTAFSIGWLTDHLHVYHHSYWGHPYYGYHYNNRHHYRHSSLNHFNHFYVNNSHSYWNFRYRDGDYWRPRRGGGARPGHDQRRAHYYRDHNRDDWSHRGSDRGQVGFTNNRDARDSSGGRQARNHDDDRGRGANNGGRGRNDGNTGANNRRDREANGDHQARNRHRGNPADRSSSGSSDNDSITFRARGARARADQERRRLGASEDLNRSSQRSASFAPSSRGTTTASNNRRPTPRTSTGSSHDRGRTAALNNPRPQVRQSAPRQHSAPTVRSAPTRSHSPRNAPSHSAPPANAPAHNAAPPSAPQQSSGSSHRSEGRSSESSSRGSAGRGESRSRRRH